MSACTLKVLEYCTRAAAAAVPAACRAVDSTETHRRVRRKLTLVCDSWFVGCNQGAGINCTPAAFQYPLMRLRFLFCSIKYLLWFGALFLGLTRGGFCSIIEFFKLLYNPPPKHVNPIGLTCLKTPNAKNREKVLRLGSRSEAEYFIL